MAVRNFMFASRGKEVATSFPPLQIVSDTVIRGAINCVSAAI